MEFVNGKDDIPYMMENKIDVWNHQPVYIYIIELLLSTYMEVS